MLSILKMMCWCANFSGISRNGSKIPICSKVEVFFPNQDPLLSFFSMINSFSRQSWKAKQVSDVSSKPTTPYLMFPVQFLFFGLMCWRGIDWMADALEGTRA
jgi:hypothetical protein